MTLTEKLISKPAFRIGAAVILTGLLSFGISTCVNIVYRLENQAENYIENLYMNNLPYLDSK
ncbi:Uncharacterised protein [uncultured archaeon]|nr:Uncharacterised protein [uncultured archaeon]